MDYKANSKGDIWGNDNQHGAKACSRHLVKEADLQYAILHDLKTLASSLSSAPPIHSRKEKKRIRKANEIPTEKNRMIAIKKEENSELISG
ncbi:MULTISPECIES: hypothetical protein [unclassified Anoxybacillus]|jgi:site-specific DNA recombinase|uniref:hypothetical protein n=1 Tax=unclassified Anoxybacillus TaxID=2639704 RepID=UPI0005CD16A3|nr:MULTISPECIES: hypothetical protein [unclassified Anoxybacillus]OQM47234.1 hypothetical protein B6A27_01900 [Anoxybacillus sp. UARK-01]